MFNGDEHTGNDSGPRLYFANLVYARSIGTSFARGIYATNFFCKEIEIKKTALVLVTTLAVFTAGTAQADTLELADGRLIEGDFISSSNGIIMFDTGGGIEAFPEDKVVGLFLSAGIATKEAMSADSVTVPI